jgi:hypothetical protein
MKPGDLLQVDSTVACVRGLWKDPSREIRYEALQIPGGAVVMLLGDRGGRYGECYNVLWMGRVLIVEREVLHPVRPAGGVV